MRCSQPIINRRTVLGRILCFAQAHLTNAIFPINALPTGLAMQVARIVLEAAPAVTDTKVAAAAKAKLDPPAAATGPAATMPGSNPVLGAASIRTAAASRPSRELSESVAVLEGLQAATVRRETPTAAPAATGTVAIVTPGTMVGQTRAAAAARSAAAAAVGPVHAQPAQTANRRLFFRLLCRHVRRHMLTDHAQLACLRT